MEPKSISIKQLMDRIRRHPMLSSIPLETIVDYTVDFFRIVGLPTTYNQKTTLLKIDNYRGKLPEDFMEMVQVRGLKTKYTVFDTTKNYSKNSIVFYNNNVWKFVVDHPAGSWNADHVEEYPIEGDVIYFRYTTDNFHTSSNKILTQSCTYKIQGNIIYTGSKEGYIEISYYALDVDNCGLPTIPDNSKFIRAIENYIKVQHFSILFDEGKLQPQILQRADQEYCWAVAACESEFHRMTPDKFESVFNFAKSMLIRDDEHSRGYATMGNKPFLKIH